MKDNNDIFSMIEDLATELNRTYYDKYIKNTDTVDISKIDPDDLRDTAFKRLQVKPTIHNNNK